MTKRLYDEKEWCAKRFARNFHEISGQQSLSRIYEYSRLRDLMQLVWRQPIVYQSCHWTVVSKVHIVSEMWCRHIILALSVCVASAKISWICTGTTVCIVFLSNWMVFFLFTFFLVTAPDNGSTYFSTDYMLNCHRRVLVISVDS